MKRVRTALAEPELRARIPLAVHRAAEGDFGVWSSLVSPKNDVVEATLDKLAQATVSDPTFTFLASVCRDEYFWKDDPGRRHPAKRELAPSIAAAARFDQTIDWAQYCTAMGFTRSTPESVAIAIGAMPALMLVGQLDLITPKTWSDHAMQFLRNVRTIEFPNTGHSVLRKRSDCAGNLVGRFFDDPDGPLDTKCVDDLPRTRWALR